MFLQVQECGEDVKNLENEPAIVLVNHQSTADVPLLLYAFHPHGRVLANLRWIINTILRYSSIGIISLIHGDFFVQQVSRRGLKITAGIFFLIRGSYPLFSIKSKIH